MKRAGWMVGLAALLAGCPYDVGYYPPPTAVKPADDPWAVPTATIEVLAAGADPLPTAAPPVKLAGEAGASPSPDPSASPSPSPSPFQLHAGLVRTTLTLEPLAGDLSLSLGALGREAAAEPTTRTWLTILDAPAAILPEAAGAGRWSAAIDQPRPGTAEPLATASGTGGAVVGPFGLAKGLHVLAFDHAADPGAQATLFDASRRLTAIDGKTYQAPVTWNARCEGNLVVWIQVESTGAWTLTEKR